MKRLVNNIKPWHLISFGIIILLLEILNIPTKIFSPNIVFFIKEKEVIYFLISIMYAILIFVNQNLNSDKYKNELEVKIEKLEAIRSHRDNIINTAVKWLDDKDTEIILFYFPLTFIPAYWTDFGDFFKSRLKQKIDNLSKEDNKKIIFIGPDSETTGNFDKIMSLIESKDIKSILTNENDRVKKINSYGEKDVQKICDKLRKSYPEDMDNFIKSINNNNKEDFILARPISNAKYWYGKPTFSFIYRKTKLNPNAIPKQNVELIIADTFGIIEEPINARKVFSDNGELINENTIEEILKNPPFYEIKNDKVSNLMISSIMQTAFHNEDEILSHILN